MYFKRFLQLFLIYILAALVLTGIVSTNFLQNKSLTFVLAVLVSYTVLTLPLVLLTVLKTNKKATSVGAQGQGGKVRQVLSGLPGYLILSCQTKDGMQETTIMSFIQSVHEEIVFYMVADKHASKVQNIKVRPRVSFTTWFDSLEKGERLSSNQVDAEILEGLSAKEVVKHEPNLLKLHENATNMAIIKLKIHSLVHESFRDGAEIIEFK
ncbi:pyridoxamine 5'-phosphate oxidase family protein [Lactococcus garvieae]|uniref:pyridoxamine 5'-phosphate oxidase family protein n=1 Tax=Lactococcus formosensis TaxID=1281486 RepID=UPI0013FDC935|nr:pyridoxamine 5'-phosphate oxidase family protein [Lactococcus garvieae]